MTGTLIGEAAAAARLSALWADASRRAGGSAGVTVLVAAVIGFIVWLTWNTRRTRTTIPDLPDVNRLILDRANYLGGHPDWVTPAGECTLIFEDEGFFVTVNDSPAILRDWEDVTGMATEGPTEARRRVTVTRALTIGLIALAVPKTERLAYLVITDIDGEFIFEVTSHTAIELRAALQPYNRYLANPANPDDRGDSGADVDDIPPPPPPPPAPPRTTVMPPPGQELPLEQRSRPPRRTPR